MKLFFLVFLQLLFGWGVLNKFKYDKNLLSKLALSYLVGLLGTSLVVYVIELLQVRITYASVTLFGLAIALLINLDVKRFWASLQLFKKMDVKQVNIYDLVSVLGLAFFLSYSVWRMYHLPVVPYDALVGIDLLAKSAVEDGHVVSSIFTRPDLKVMLSTQPFYAPLTSFNQIAYRLTEAPFGQVWIPFATIAFCVFAYIRIKEATHSILAGLSLLLLFCSTELYAYTYLLQTDLANALFFGIGLVFLLDYFKDKSQKINFWLSTLFFAIAVWTRIETIVIIGLCSVLVVWEFLKEKKYKEMVLMTALFLAIPLIANILWNGVFYNFVLPFHPETKGEIVWAGKYASSFTGPIVERMNFYLFSTDYWGYILFIYLIVALANAVIYRDKISIYTLVFIVLFYVSYFLMLHHFAKVNVEATYRRGLFKLLFALALFFGELRLLQVLGSKMKDWVLKKA